ncbi:MAG: hypothetical protein ACQESO_07290 [Bacillota bacterium]
MIEIYLLSVHDWLRSLTLACAVLSEPGREVYFIDPEEIDQEVDSLLLLADRMSVNLIDATGSEGIKTALSGTALEHRTDTLSAISKWSQLLKRFGSPRGVFTAPANSPVDCLKAAAVATRLGYYFLPLDTNKKYARMNFQGADLTWFGDKDLLTESVGADIAAEFTCINSDPEALAYLQKKGCPVDYLVILNSADLFRDTERGSSLGELWVKGLSLNVLILASYRQIYLFDAAEEHPDPQKIEYKVNEMVEASDLKLRFQAVLASPAAVPFFYEEKKAIGAVTEEMIRDIHVRLNNDLFFDLAEGRLIQNTPGGLSAQLISTKRFPEIQKNLGRNGRDVLIAGVPHVDTGIIFSGDQALMEAQLLPLLEEAGFRLNVIQDRDSHYRIVSEALKDADYFLFTGHGGPEGLHTHGRTLNRGDLPLLPPLVAYVSACSTVGLVPHWFSPTEGLEWQGVAVDSRHVIGISFVEKGALCFVGGATVEDLQYSTSIYAIFMEALLVKGLSVGEAVQATRNFISLFAATLMKKKPEAYRKYRWGTANAIHQQILLGDPAFIPAPGNTAFSKFPIAVESVSASVKKVVVEIPESRWKRRTAQVNEKDASKYYYRCRNIEVNTPYGENIISWGDYYRVAPDAENISETAVMSSFLHMSADLPPGEAPKGLMLVEAEAAETACLLCGKDVDPVRPAIEAANHFKLPYLLQPPIELDMRKGWAFNAEQLEGFVRLHWLVPLLLIDEATRSAVRLKKLVFEVESALSFKVRGKISGHEINDNCLVCAGYPQQNGPGDHEKEPLLNSQACFLVGPDGSFKLDCADEISLSLQEQFPLYELLVPYQGFRNKLYKADHGTGVVLEPEFLDKVKINGIILDRANGEAISGALVRIFRGENDPVGDPLIEAFAGEAVSGEKGDFMFELPAGKYILYAAAVLDGKRYKSRQWLIEPKEGEDFFRIFAIDQAAIIKGAVTIQGYVPPDPPVISLKRYPKVDGEGALVKVPLGRDGSYECLVSFQDRFSIVLEEEGWQAINDTNEGDGYKLEAQQVLIRDYLLVPDESG